MSGEQCTGFGFRAGLQKLGQKIEVKVPKGVLLCSMELGLSGLFSH